MTTLWGPFQSCSVVRPLDPLCFAQLISLFTKKILARDQIKKLKMQQFNSGARVVRTLSDPRVSDSVHVVMVDFPNLKTSPCVAIKFVALNTERRSLKVRLCTT